jgi:transposase
MVAVERHLCEFDRLGEELELLDREIAQHSLDDPAIKRLLTITGINLTVAAGLMAAIGDIGRFDSPQKLVSYFGLNPRVLIGTGSGRRSASQVVEFMRFQGVDVRRRLTVKDAQSLGAISADAVKHLALCWVERRPPGEHHRPWPFGRGKDARRHRARPRRLPARRQNPLRHGLRHRA